jgi:transcriptional regulator GlxA family with amidase domain
MKVVSILVPETAVMQAIADPQYLFSSVNQFLAGSGRPPLFTVQLVAEKKEVLLGGGKFVVRPDKLLHEVKSTDMVFIPALSGDLREAVEINSRLAPWIVKQYTAGAEVASLCVGAFLLASTGLLNGKKCSTHWGFTGLLREMFPEVNVVDGSIVTEESRIYSSGGANSYWNLLLHLVEKYAGRETAVLASKYFAIDIDRSSQAAFAIFKGQKAHNDETVKRAQEYIEGRVAERFTVEALAGRLAVGKRSFERRFRQATGNSVLEYIQRVRVEAAKRGFETTRKNITEVMLEVGYTDVKAFRTIFRKVTGLSPLEYRNKYRKQDWRAA